jgi:hypothetical protein
MTLRQRSARMTSRVALALGVGVMPIVHAQTATTTAPAADVAPYQDRVMDDLATAADTDNAAEPAYDGSGWPRFVRLEGRLGTEPFDASNRTRAGFAVYGLIDTPNHGSLSIDGSHSPHAGRGTLTLRQRALPLAGGWLANHELGIINTPLPEIARRPSRVLLPSAIVQGIGGAWEQPATGWQIQASHGEPGRLDGQPTSVFRPGSGQRSSLGLQWHAGAGGPQAADPIVRPGWTLAAQVETARQISLIDQPLLPGDRFDADSTLLAARHETSDRRVQVQGVQTRGGATSTDSRGLWLDAEWDDGPRRHGAGLYRLDPGLNWAGQSMASDVEGATLRSAWRTRQWSAEASLDWLRSVSGTSADGSYITASGRRRMGPDSQLGAGVSLRDFNGRAWSSYSDWRWGNAWGRSGLRLDLSGGASQASEQRLSYDQEWRVPQGWTLSTSLALGRAAASGGEASQSLWAAALNLAAPITPRAGLRASVDTEQRSGGQRQHSLSAGANWRINTRWSLEGQVNRNIGRRLSGLSLDPLAPPSTVFSTTDRSFYAVLRYELQAGTRRAPLGGRAQEGGGRIQGIVYLDANRSGTQEASEIGAADVTVTLDNRYAVRTDARGRFEFPFVAAGPRTLTVRNETLPLPWSVVGDGQVRVDLQLRDTLNLSIPVQKAD